MKTLVLKGSDVGSLVDAAAAIDAVAGALAGHARGETQMPPKVYVALPDVGGDFRAMPVRVGDHAGVKWINAHPDNPARYGLPSVIGVFILSDAATARPLAIMDATGLTSLRTGAAAAVATRALARPDAATLGIIGCGAQARAVIECHRAVMQVGEIRLCDTSHEVAEELAASLSHPAVTVTDVAGAASCDVLCTLTPSRAPLVDAAMLRPGTHVNAMGADAPGKQELDPAILTAAAIFVDDAEQACESGEVNVALRDGTLVRAAIAGTLGEVLAGIRPGRADGDRTRITIFDSTGLAVQDLAVAALVYERAEERAVGLAIDLVDGA